MGAIGFYSSRRDRPCPACFERLAANAATATLAPRRLRSAVKSTPGLSSKSSMSNRMFCSGVANAPKFGNRRKPGQESQPLVHAGDPLPLRRQRREGKRTGSLTCARNEPVPTPALEYYDSVALRLVTASRSVAPRRSACFSRDVFLRNRSW
jgi:hypothetical protein